MNNTATTLIPAALLAALLAAPAAAQQKPSAEQPAKKADAQAGAPAKPGEPADPAAHLVAALKDWDSKLESLKASFTQEVHFKEAGLKQSIEGTLLYVKPNLLRIEHLKPSRQIVVTDKKEIWIYKPEDKQAVRTEWEAWRRTQDQSFSGILDFGNYAALTAKNEARADGGRDGAPPALTFVPRSGKNYSLTIKLSPEDNFPTGAELSVEGTVISTRLKDVQRNVEIDKAQFRFSPPKGTEILEFSK